MKFYYSVIFATLVFNFAGVVLAEDFTKFATWETKSVPIPSNPENINEFQCNLFESFESLNKGLKNIGWSESEKTSRSVDFRKYIVVVVSKPSEFKKSDKLKLAGLYSDREKLFIHYNIEEIQGERAQAESFGLTSFVPALLVQVPKPLYNSYNLVCRSDRL